MRDIGRAAPKLLLGQLGVGVLAEANPLMRMPVMDVGIVRVSVCQLRVHVRMGVRFAAVPGDFV